MAIDPKKYIESFFNITKGYIKTHEDASTIKFLKSAVDNISGVLDAIDKFLLSNNVNVKESYKTISDKLSNYKDKGTSLLTQAKSDIKQKGLKSYLTEKKDAISSKLKEKFADDGEKSGAPPPTQDNPLISVMKKLTSSIESLTSATNDKVDNPEERKAAEKEGRLARFRKMFDQQKERASKRKAEVDAEKNRFGGKDGKGKKGGGILGMLLSAIGGVGGMILGGFKGMMLRFVPMVAGLAGKAIVRTIVSLVPWLAKKIVPSIARATAGVLGTVARGALTGAGAAVLGGAKALGTVALGALSGTAGLVLGGVLLAGAAIYGGYKLYKYLNRNSTGDGVYSDLTRLRLHLYGFNDTNREHYHKLFDLEMLMKNYHEYRNNTLILKKFDGDFKKQVLELFEVSREEKEKYNLLNNWFIRRFLPAYKSFMEAFYSVNNKIYLDDLDKLKEDELFKLISVLRIPSSIHDVKAIPVFDKPDTIVDKQQIDDMVANLREKIKQKSDAGKGKAPDNISQENKSNAKDARTAQDMANKALRDTAKSNLPTPGQPNKTVPSSNKNDMSAPASSGSEDGNKPKEDPVSQAIEKASTPLNQATGALLRGNKALEGIATKLDMSKIYNLDPNVLELFSGMAKEYNTLTGKVINVNEAFRNKEDQAALYQKYGPGRAAKPGTSLHEHGLAIDINSATADELDKLGLMRKYGFTRPIGGEKWHIEPAGVALNPTLARDNPASRIGAVMSSPGRGGGGYATEASATQYKRNVGLQKSIYDSGASNEINPLEAINKKLQQPAQIANGEAAANSGNSIPMPTAPAPSGSYPNTVNSTGGPQDRTKGVNLYGGGSSSGGMPAPDYERKPPQMQQPQGLDQRKPPGYDMQPNMDMGRTGPMSPEDAVRKAASVTGMNPETMMAFAKIESGMRPGVTNPRSSATGLFQITSGTWKGLMGKYGKQFNIPADAQPTDPYYNSLLGSLYAKDNLKSLGNFQQAGIREDVALYLAHHYGPSGGNKIIKAAMANPGSHVGTAMSSDAYQSNIPELGNKTVGQYIEYLNAKMTRAGSKLTTPPNAGAQPQPGVVVPSTPQPNPSTAPTLPGNNPQASNTPSSQGGMAGPQPPVRQAPQPSLSPFRPSFSAQDQAPQPSKALSLDKTESLLTGMSETLVGIRKILESIDGKGGMQNKEEGSNKPSEGSQQPPSKQPLVVDNNRQPSQNAVSMSRRPVQV